MAYFSALSNLAIALFTFSALVAAQGPSFTPVLPHSYPLAVRNPYTSGT